MLVKVGRCNQKLETDYADIRRELLRFRYDKFYQGHGNRVPIKRFAELCGLSRQTMHNLSNENCAVGLLPATVTRIKNALDLVINKGVRWKRKGGTWHGFFPNGDPLPPQPQLPPLSRGPVKHGKYARDDHTHL